jgi:hypothetical protein
MEEKDCNIAIQALGFDIISKYFIEIANYYSNHKPIYFISLGSGFAQLEYKFKHIIEWICIDPDPSSYSFNIKSKNIEDILIQPHFASVKDCIQSNPEIVNNCVLLLNWTPPTINEQDNQFEKEAINLLKPKGILSLFEQYQGKAGSSGSEYFHSIFANAIKVMDAVRRSSNLEKRYFVNKRKLSYVKSKLKWKKIESDFDYRINNYTRTIHKGNPFNCDTVYIVWFRHISEPQFTSNKLTTLVECNYLDNKKHPGQMFLNTDDSDDEKCIIC